MKKCIDINKLGNIIGWLREAGISFSLSFILGGIEESISEMLETLILIKRMNLGFEEFNINVGIQVFPGTYEAKRFLNQHTDYRWLERSRTEKNYRQINDKYGNPLYVKYFTPHYSEEYLTATLDSWFAEELKKQGFSSFKEQAAEKHHLCFDPYTKFANPYFQKSCQRLIRNLEANGEPWAILHGGIMSKLFPVSGL